jgi:hypothetical protein
MKEIKFDPTGSAISVNLEFTGLIAAVYAITLAEKNSNQVVFTSKGNNQNSEDDRYELPGTALSNDQRILMISSEFYGLDPANFKEYKIVISFFQGTKLLDSVTEKGIITGKTQSLLQFSKLVANI